MIGVPVVGQQVVVDGVLIVTVIKIVDEKTVAVETGHGSLLVTLDRVEPRR